MWIYVSLALALAPPSTSNPPPQTSPQDTQWVRGVDHVGLAVSDLSASKAFFIEVLGFTVRGQDKKYPAWFLTNGEVLITLWQTADGAKPFDRVGQVGLHHLALNVVDVAALDALHERIKAHPGTKIQFGPEPSYGGPAKHMMFFEPSGNRIELIHRP